MTHSLSPGARFKCAVKDEQPLQVIGVVNAYIALMAERTGYRALYLSGASISNFSYGLPDIGLTTEEQVLQEVRKITNCVEVPLLVDIDTGWGDPKHAVSMMDAAGAAGVHIEDQVTEKKCGHLEGKKLISTEEMVNRVSQAVQGKSDRDFVVMARTDAYSVEGIESTIERAKAYLLAGADMIFVEAIENLGDYRTLKNALDCPLLANATEFGQTPLYSRDDWSSVGVDIVLYPLTIARAMNRTASDLLLELRQEGSQGVWLERMQTRDELYQILNYDAYEESINEPTK